MNSYQLNPVYEWIGHVASGLIGGVYGSQKSSGLVTKELTANILTQLQDPVQKRKLVSQAIAHEKEEIKANYADIKWCEDEYKRIMSDPNADALEKEEAEWYKDVEEFKFNISNCEHAIQELKQLYKSGDNETLASVLANRYWTLKTILANRRQIEKKHKFREAALTYGGVVGGAVGYHYAKKGLKKLGKKIASAIDAKQALRRLVK